MPILIFFFLSLFFEVGVGGVKNPPLENILINLLAPCYIVQLEVSL
jgi:hypothetical protein